MAEKFSFNPLTSKLDLVDIFDTSTIPTYETDPLSWSIASAQTLLTGDKSGTATLTFNAFVTNGGLSTDFVKGDGSLDSATYLTAETDPLSLHLNGDNSMAGNLTVGTDNLYSLGTISAGFQKGFFHTTEFSYELTARFLDNATGGTIYNGDGSTLWVSFIDNGYAIRAKGIIAPYSSESSQLGDTSYPFSDIYVNGINGGTSSQFVKGDGTLDGSTYLVGPVNAAGFLLNDGSGNLSWTPGSATYTTSFTDGNLVSGILTVTHSLGSKYCAVSVYDNSDKVIIPDEITGTDDNTTTIDLSSFGTITDTWNVRIIK